jgi:hypothetical protein
MKILKEGANDNLKKRGVRGTRHAWQCARSQLHVALGPLSGVTTTSRALGVAGTINKA